jgi:hypothetical protein
MRTDRVEAQHREKVRGVRQEGRIHEVLLYETLLHQPGLRETGAGNLILMHLVAYNLFHYPAFPVEWEFLGRSLKDHKGGSWS